MKPLELHASRSVKIVNLLGTGSFFSLMTWLAIAYPEDLALFGAAAILSAYFLYRSVRLALLRGPVVTIDSHGFQLNGEAASPSWDEIAEIEYMVHSPGPTRRHDLIVSLRDFASFERRWRAAQRPGSTGKLEHPLVLPMEMVDVPRRELMSRIEKEWGHPITTRGPAARRELRR